MLDLVRQFIHEVDAEDDRGRKTGKRFLIFPRYQQLDCVRRLVGHARDHGTGQRYLIQHSAGSGKSFTIAWLAHRLSVLHDSDDRRVFDSVIVVTDRRVLDRQLQGTIRQFEQTLGVVENIDQTSRQLREALEAGRTIIVTTLQKFPVIAEQIGQLPGKRFAVIVDEAHSSQSGESTKSLKTVLAAGSLEEAEQDESDAETPEEELEDRVLEEIRRRGPQPNLSTFAFTATPKPKTLELFGSKRPDGKFEPFHRYSMRQAIEEGFILNVLASYATYKAYWRLLKKIEDDPRYDKRKAEHLLKSFVELHPHAITEKVAVCVEHFAAQVAGEIGGRAKAMIVTRSRLHAVRTKLALDDYLAEKGHPWKALVAFSGTVKDGGESYTESGMNSAGQDHVISDRQTAAEFEKPEYRFLVVASKFQTGFDQPLLHTMYVDKKLGGGERRPDAVPPEPHAPRQAGHDGARLRQRGRGDPEGLRAVLRDHPAVRGNRPQPALRGPGPAVRLRRVHGGRRRLLRRGLLRPQDDTGPALRGAGTGAPAFRRARPRRGWRLPRPAHRLRAPVLVPLPGADVRRSGPGKALRLRPALPAPAAGRP